MSDRGLPTALDGALDDTILRPALLMEAAFLDSAGNDDTLRIWTGIGPLTVGGETYTGTGDLISVEGIEEVVEAVSRGVSFRLNGVGLAEVNSNGDSILDLAFRTEYQNRACTVALALFDDAGAVVGTIPLFSGFMDVLTPTEDGEAATIELTAENAFIALERPAERTYTKEDQRELYPDDGFFDEVAELQNREIRLD